MFKQIQENSDWLGIFSSSLCLFHCLLLPILANVLAHTEAGESAFFDYIFLVLSFIAIRFSIKSHTKGIFRVLFGLCFGILALGILTEEQWRYSAYLAYGASLSLIVLHYFNFRACQSCTHAVCK